MPYTDLQAQSHALELVKLAIQSKAVDLKGNNNNNINDAERYAEADAKYLAKLIKDLTAALQ